MYMHSTVHYMQYMYCTCTGGWPPVLTHSSSHQDGGGAILERAECVLSLRLTAVAMDTGTGVPILIEEVVQRITTLLGLNEHQSETVAYRKGQGKVHNRILCTCTCTCTCTLYSVKFHSTYLYMYMYKHVHV